VNRLIIVSNRVAIPKPANQPAAGGLAVALNEALRHYNGIWFGWSGEVSEGNNTRVKTITRGKVSYALLDLPQSDYEEYYNGYANRTLWPLFHYRIDLVVYDRLYLQSYLRVNARFANSLAPLLKADDLIWVHDYHLIACGEELRRMGFDNRMGFFLHIPFPTPQVLLTLPKHEALVRALFAYDVVGFQAESDLRALHQYVIHEAGGTVEPDGRLNAFGRTIRAQVFPIGIDADGFAKLSRSVTANNYYKRMHESMSARELIIGVDRLDYSKALPQRLEAFERLLEDYPETRNKVSLMQIAPTSREDVPEYHDIRKRLETATGHINGRFAEFDWVPIRYLNRAMGRAALAGLFRASRISLVTPYRDGMNLVAKEYVAAQDQSDPGCLVLSRFAGAAQQLTEGALIINPYDTLDMVEAMQQALNMSLQERQERWQSLIEVIRRQDISWWRDSFVEALASA
jgi:trehalose 6-phosphate synthase